MNLKNVEKNAAVLLKFSIVLTIINSGFLELLDFSHELHIGKRYSLRILSLMFARNITKEKLIINDMNLFSNSTIRVGVSVFGCLLRL